MAYAHTGTVFAAPLAERVQRPSLLARIMRAMIESRMRAAQREINAHRHLFRQTVVQDLKQTTLRTDSKLPFTS